MHGAGHGLQQIGDGWIFGVVPAGEDLGDQLAAHTGDHDGIHPHRGDAAQPVGQAALALGQQAPLRQQAARLFQRPGVDIGGDAVVAAAALQQGGDQQTVVAADIRHRTAAGSHGGDGAEPGVKMLHVHPPG